MPTANVDVQPGVVVLDVLHKIRMAQLLLHAGITVAVLAAGGASLAAPPLAHARGRRSPRARVRRRAGGPTRSRRCEPAPPTLREQPLR